MQKLLRTALFLMLVLAPRVSPASPDYPDAIANSLGVAFTYDCALCHSLPKCGCATVVTPFGLSLMAFGAKGNDVRSLFAALDTSRAREWDSDGDGLSDVSELILGSNPNTPAFDSASPTPRHGCSLRSFGSSRAPVSAAAALGLLAFARIRARRSRGRHRIVT